MWNKGGLIYEPDRKIGQYSHAQMPRAVQISKAMIRVFYSSRDRNNKQRPYYIDIDADYPNIVYYQHPTPILELGDEGSFDHDGIQISQVDYNPYNETYIFTYTGWNVEGDYYRTDIGMAVGHLDNLVKTGSFQTMTQGMKTTAAMCKEPMMMEVATHVDPIEGRLVYRLSAPIVSEDECTCSPSFVMNRETGITEMFFSKRRYDDTRREDKYRIFKTLASDNFAIVEDAGITVGDEKHCFDYDMICYCDVIYCNERYLMFYNGNEYGKHGFGYAETVFL